MKKELTPYLSAQIFQSLTGNDHVVMPPLKQIIYIKYISVNTRKGLGNTYGFSSPLAFALHHCMLSPTLRHFCVPV
jgi:hypothetical protein